MSHVFKFLSRSPGPWFGSCNIRGCTIAHRWIDMALHVHDVPLLTSVCSQPKAALPPSWMQPNESV